MINETSPNENEPEHEHECDSHIASGSEYIKYADPTVYMTGEDKREEASYALLTNQIDDDEEKNKAESLTPHRTR